jgi:hypothetical protein
MHRTIVEFSELNKKYVEYAKMFHVLERLYLQLVGILPLKPHLCDISMLSPLTNARLSVERVLRKIQIFQTEKIKR